MRKPFLHIVAEDIKERFGNDIADIAIVFNNKRPITYLKKHLADVYGRAIWSPQFFTIQEFLKTSTTASEASALGQFFYLYQLHNELLLAEGSEPEILEEFYPIAEIILNDFSQLDYELVNIDHIYMELHDRTKIDLAFQHFTPEQQQFIQQFWQTFSATGHTGLQQRFLRLWKRLPLLYRKFKAKLEQENQINYPTLYRNLAEGRAEKKHFADHYKKILFVGFNALNKAEVLLFKKWQEEGKALFYFDVDAYYLDDKQQEAGLFIRRNMYGHGLHNALGESPDIIGGRRSEINVYAASGKISQSKLLHDILEKNEDPTQTSAILLADESLLVSLLQSLPDVQPNITTGYPLMQSPIYGLLDLWLLVQEAISHLKKDKVPFSYVETFVNHPMVKLSSTEKNAILNASADKQLFDIDIRDLSIKTSVVPHFFQHLENPTELLPALIRMIERLLDALSSQDKISQIDSHLLIETKKVILQLQLGLGRIGNSSIAFQIGLIRKVLAPISAAIEGDPLRGLQIMGLLESRCLNFDNIYILGANEGILPKTTASPTFLPNSLRKAYDLPVLENQDALSAYLFYRHLQYSTGIHVFYNSVVDESSTGEESRFLKQLQFESNFRFNIFTQQQPIRFAEATPELIIPKTGKIWTHMWETFVQNKKRLSATALTTYLQSPLQFFLKHVAEIKEPPVLSHEFEMNRLGTVIHQVMETILKPYKGQENFTPTQQLIPKVDAVEALVTAEIGRQYQTDVKQADDLNSMQRIMHKIASSYVKMYLEYDIAHYKAFRIIELENDEDYSLEFPINIQGNIETIRLYGIIDRVDEVIDQNGQAITRIVDYKTGGDSVEFKELEKVFGPNTENKALVQTLFYTYIFEQVTKRRNLEPHLYVARRMREEGTLFRSKNELLKGESLPDIKNIFVDFLRRALEEIFNPDIPFKHNPDSKVYPSDPYKLFYRNVVREEETER